MIFSRRNILQQGVAGLGVAALGRNFGMPANAAIRQLVIAYGLSIDSWDPTLGSGSVDPGLQGMYQTVFDFFIYQNPDLSFAPGLITKWGWNDDRSKIMLETRRGVKWHDGSDFTPEDVVWSLERAADEATGNPIQVVWKNIANFEIQDHVITADVKSFDPVLFKWMSFFTGFVLPKAYYTKVGKEGFEKAPIGTGPYMVLRYEADNYVRLRANPYYWGAQPAFKNVTIKFIRNVTDRIEEVKSGRSHVTLEIPYQEYDNLIKSPNLKGAATPISDIGLIFINDIGVMKDRNVRLATHHAIDKQKLVDELLNGYGVPIDTLQTPEYTAFDPDTKVGYDPEKAIEYLKKSGYNKDNPVIFTVQTTRGYKPKDYDMIQAIVAMWREVGIKAKIEIYQSSQRVKLRAEDKLAEASFYSWGNAIGDPSTSTGFAMFPSSGQSVWDSQDLTDAIGPLWDEKDEAKRIAGYKAVDKLIASEGYVIPLLQYAQPVIYATELQFAPHFSGVVRPDLFSL